MRGLTFDELFDLLTAVRLGAADLARLREWIASLAHPAECIALIEQAAAGWQRVLDARRLTTPAHLLRAAVLLC